MNTDCLNASHESGQRSEESLENARRSTVHLKADSGDFRQRDNRREPISLNFSEKLMVQKVTHT
jgi:hypothetical protein